MIKNLKIKITVILSSILAVVIVGMMATINIMAQIDTQTRINERLLKIAYNDGKIPREYRK